jgi:ubiquinone/menaquinone biosynthesis C-methylase UbiE
VAGVTLMGSTTNAHIVAGHNPQQQLDRLRRYHPELHELVDPDRVAAWHDEVRAMPRVADHFGPGEAGGRGVHYVRAQAWSTEARATGIRQLLSFAADGHRPGERSRIVVDLLGGDGLLYTLSGELGFPGITILTCDASPYMVECAWSKGIPALLQRAQRPLLKQDSVDAVLLAYGTHHIPVEDLDAVAAEAARMLRSGGVFVVHDFLRGSPMDTWFADVVDRYSETGHRFSHFTREELVRPLRDAGFESPAVMEIDDSFICLGATAAAAEAAVGRYLVNMYGLVKAPGGTSSKQASGWALGQARSIFQYPRSGDLPACGCETRYDQATGGWRARVPRRAIVGLGRKASS